MKLKNRLVRWGIAVAAVGFIATQIPFTGTKAAVAADYTNTGGDSSGNFLGISGISNRDAIETAVVGVTIYGVYEATTGAASEPGEPRGRGRKRPTSPPPAPDTTTPPATPPAPDTTTPPATAPATP